MSERFLVQLLDGGTVTEHVRVYATAGVGVVETSTIVTVAIAADAADTTDVHGITDTALLETSAGAQAKVDLHATDTTDVHGIADTTLLTTDAELTAAIAAHAADTTDVHGIPDTTDLETGAGAAAKVEAHRLDTTDVHGIADTALLETQAGAQSKANAAQTAANTYTDEVTDALAANTATNLAEHATDTTNVHGIPDTSLLETQTGAQAKVDALETALEADIIAGDSATAAAAAAALTSHATDTTDVHGIADTAELTTTTELNTAVTVAQDAANAYTDTRVDTLADTSAANLAAHATDTTGIHGIPDTSLLETQAGAQAKATDALTSAIAYTDTQVDTLADTSAANLAAHATDTTGIHGIPDTSLLETQTGSQAKVDAHALDTTGVHGIPDTSVLETQGGAQAKATAAQAAANAYTDTEVADLAASTAANLTAHATDTTAIHGIPDTSLLETQTGSQAKVDALEAELAERTLTGFNVRGYGATGDGTTDDTAAIDAAIAAAVAAGGGTVWFPAGEYRYSARLDLDDLLGVRFQGAAGEYDTSLWTFTASGIDPLITLGSAQGVTFDSMTFKYVSSTFTGTFIATGWSAASRDAVNLRFRNCRFSGEGTAVNAVSFIRLSKAIVCSITECVFLLADAAIEGTFDAYSVSIDVTGCTFLQLNDVAILNPGESWRIRDNTFEPITSGQSSAIKLQAGHSAFALTLADNWFGDVAVAGEDWISLLGPVFGLVVSGNRFGTAGPGSGDASLVLAQGQGASITGNRFEGMRGISFTVGTFFLGVFLGGNDFNSLSLAALTNPDNARGMCAFGNYGLAHFTDDFAKTMIGQVSDPVYMLDVLGDVRVGYSGTYRFGNSGGASEFHLGRVEANTLGLSAAWFSIETAGWGLFLKSPDGTRYGVTVANGGTLTVSAL